MATMMRSSALGTAPRTARSVAARVSTTNKTASSKTSTTDVRTYLENMPGVTAPFPDVFDPAGFTNSVNLRDLRRWRESEITHGRVSMLAALGFIVGEQLEDFPAFVNYDGHITGPAITHFQQVRQGFWEPLLIAIGLAESYRVSLAWATPTGNGFNSLKDDYEPGDLGFDPLGLKPTDPEELKTLQTKELNNGRLAMIAIAAFVVQELVEQTEIFEHLAVRFEREAIEEIDRVDEELGLPTIPVPAAI